MPKNRKQQYRPRPKVPTKLNVEVEDTDALIPLVRMMGEGIAPIFSDGLLVQHREDVFTLSFLQVQYPLISDVSEAGEIDSVEQRCVAQIVVTVNQMARNIKAINDNFKKFTAKLPAEVRKPLYELAGIELTGGDRESGSTDN